ncbi:hypothetical protein C5L25_001954 [Secundilactobacillus silagei JCM 19001]|uniref:Uncharacterized protein n=1 Tax=Secundilactobacillus silagei JCM 19001 TaxID=1302250 RepID=A0A1Z5IHH5_9LACO|nr:hypothetical protein C5L25_001954 [Secundilactobacillus silagei JCM 19001]GAX01129.1 hypothetical protein IWT126_01154 [Secundilactobacillus silagei JCM 19001]
MKLKHYVMIGVAALSLGAATTAQPQTANASSYHRAYVTRSITVYHFIWGGSFANSSLGSYLRLHAGRTVHVKPFYHMGKDGYMLHVSGHGSRTYYARTNSSSWYRR